MNGTQAIAEILQREGIEFLACYPNQPLIEACALAEIRPIICRQERVGMAIADGFSRTTNGKRLGVFAMQHGPARKTPFLEQPKPSPITFPSCFYPAGNRPSGPRSRQPLAPWTTIAS